MSKSPVLFLIFNRPLCTKEVFKQISEYRPLKLYIAADGPRTGNKEDENMCIKTREVVKNINWECDVKYLFRDTNLGCKNAVAEAIDWFFKFEDNGIILEDDCLPDQTFFKFCTEMLLKYKDNTEVFSIGGNCFLPEKLKKNNCSYFFSKHVEVWGWATWRRAWMLYDRNITKFTKEKEKLKQIDYLSSNRNYNKWIKIFQNIYDNKVDTWDYQWVYTVWINQGVTILPTKNIVKNIGFNNLATHTISEDNFFSNFNLEKLKFPLIHPNIINRNLIYDNWLDDNVNSINYNFIYRVIKKFYALLKIN